MASKKEKPQLAQSSDDRKDQELPKAFPSWVSVPDSHSIHNNIKFQRQRAGLTLEALSLVTKGVDPDGVGISRVSLSRYETGSEPGLRELKILSWAFRKPLAYLVYGDSYDPMDEGKRDPLDLVVDDIVGDIVINILERKGIIPKEVPEDTQKYQSLLEAAKKLAK